MEVNGYTIKPGANLSNADLSNANLQGADLSETDLSDAILSKGTQKKLGGQCIKGVKPSQKLFSVVLGQGLVKEEEVKVAKFEDNQRWRYDDTTDEHALYSRWDLDDFGRTVETDEFGVRRKIGD
jgi:uncharacterized protein YjbI with pentapeptide repeats